MMFNPSQLEVDSWKGDWGLPSIDYKCLEVLAFARFTNAPITINYSNNPFKSVNGYLPMVSFKKRIISNRDQLIECLEKQNLSPDFGLSNQQLAEEYATISMLDAQLEPALLYAWWLDENNCLNFTKPLYRNALKFPLNWYYPNAYEKAAKHKIYTLYSHLDSDNDIMMEIYTEAIKCINGLENRLGNNFYFFGSHPTLLDAVAYSYLGPLSNAPLNDNKLQAHIKTCKNLCIWIDRISREYFKLDWQAHKCNEKKKEESNKKIEVIRWYKRDETRNVLIGLTSLITMVVYSFKIGLIRLSDTSDDEEEEDEEN
ncbi:metaxin-1 [Adelges cooleyi]|uniref:metaxin-1 n=1 Tax=Adelges cooleyi TaxID=133065 RepID=UPI0021808867|nr:metaxin-1 [Adelges cooleyi]XP_050430555.1 metaxin-1 [Adelges cooleyi]